MKTIGIIAEFNPFHLGHQYLISQGKKLTGSTHAVVAMSGNTVQRGDFAIVDKFARGAEAVKMGADLVLEIPFCYCSQSAAYLAKGGVQILNQLGLVDYLVFGSETNQLETQKKMAAIFFEEADQKAESKKNKGRAKFSSSKK